MGKPGTMLYWETFDVLDRVKPEKLKILLRAIRNYSQYGQSPDFAGDEALELVWPVLEQRLSADNERYRQRSEQATNAANARWGHASACKSMPAHADACEPMPEMPTTTTTSSPTTTSSATVKVHNGCAENQPVQPQSPPPKAEHKEPARRFVPPTVEEVAAYCRERRNRVDALRFVDYYTANGWKVGRNAMKDWKACVRTWERDNTPRAVTERSRIKSEEEYETSLCASGFVVV